jgi:hypothetical protein
MPQRTVFELEFDRVAAESSPDEVAAAVAAWRRTVQPFCSDRMQDADLVAAITRDIADHGPVAVARAVHAAGRSAQRQKPTEVDARRQAERKLRDGQ